MKFKNLIYLFIVTLLSISISITDWGVVTLSIIILITYFLYRPNNIFHPNNIVFAFFGLYVVLSGNLNFILYLLEWQYVLPWGQFVFWDTFSKITLYEIECLFLILFFLFKLFIKNDMYEKKIFVDFVRKRYVYGIYLFVFLCLISYIQLTAGFYNWLYNYGSTYTSMRSGYGWLNLIIMTFGNALVFLMGLLTYKSRKWRKFFLYVISFFIILMLGYFQGLKSRLPFLLILFYFPYMQNIIITNRKIVFYGMFFVIFLYFTTLFRSQGFYSSFPAFLEYLIGYFNSFQLHEYIVESYSPDFLTTIHYGFNKLWQLLGFLGEDAKVDISIEFTKEYFPSMWYDYKATQQWPLLTELYLNFYGMAYGWIPLIIYTYILSQLYKLAIQQNNYYLTVIYLMEFLRLFTVLRGTLLPWALFVIVVEYITIYLIMRLAIKYEK